MSVHNPKHTSDRITVGLKFLFACPCKCLAPGVERTSDRRAVLKANLNLPPMASLSYRRQTAIPLRHSQRAYFKFLRRFRTFTERLNGMVWDAIRISKFFGCR